MKKFAKRFILAFLTATLAVLGVLLGACGGKDPKPSEEQGTYYYDAGAEEYTLELVLGNTFTLDIQGKELTGKYELDGELLTLKVKKGDTLSATLYDNAVTLAYESVTYRFLKKIDYTVTFNTNGGSQVDSATVVNGKTVKRPADPQKGDMVFVGWYTDNNTFRNAFSFTQPITGNVTLYARFVENIDPEFAVSFDAGEGAAPIAPTTTVGHKTFNLPAPVWAGHNFVGWWISDYGDPERLTARYEEQLIEQPITLYAVWESNAPAVSVSESGVVWTGRSGNNSYTITILGPEGNALVDNLSVATANYAYDFTKVAEGDYTVKVTANGQTTTAYFKNRGLATVTSFEVEGNTLLFNPVSHATNYLITVDCGTAGADHKARHTDLDLGNKTSFDFSECDMKEGGITFVVKATAKGYVASVSKPFICPRTLDAVTGITFDAAKDVVSWNAVKNATSYTVTVLQNGAEVGRQDDVAELSFDLQYYNKGNYTVKVTPKAFGWASPAAAEGNCEKKHLATPSNIHLAGTTLGWDPVDGATGYEVIFNGAPHRTTDNSLPMADGFHDPNKSSYTINVRALAPDAKENSLLSPDYIIRNGEMGDVRYGSGKVVWDAVFGVEAYRVKLNDGEPAEVSGKTEYAIVFTQKGVNIISVCTVNADGTASAWKSIDVDVYSIQFDAQGGVDVPTLYKAKGDPLDLEEPTRYGYTFSGWYTEAGENGKPFDSATFEDEYDRTLYAKWTGNKYLVSFDLGEYGTGEIPSKEVTFGSGYDLPVPQTGNNMYAFAGWYDATLKTQYTDYTGKSRGDYLTAGPSTFTAKWVPILKFSKNNDTYSVSKGEGINYVTEVTIPEQYEGATVTAVGDFSNCTRMQKIKIPNSVTEINLGSDGAAFINCDALTDIEIYESSVHADVEYYSVDGVLFYWNGGADGGRMEIKYYPYARKATEYTIPGTIETEDGKKNVTVIPQGAFYASSYTDSPLTTINIPATVSLIEEKAFYFFYNLTTVNFLPVQEGEAEAKDLAIRPNAFGDPGKSLSTARIASIKLPKRLSENPREAFSGLSYLAYIDIEEGGTFSSVDGLLVQQSDYGLELVYYPVNRSLDEAGKAIEIPLSDTGYLTTAKRAKEFVVPDSIYAIGDEAVMYNTALQKVVIHGSVQRIGVSAFQGLSNLKELIFEGDANDTDLTIEAKAFLGERWSGASSRTPYWTTSLTSLTLPANLKKVGQYAFGSLGGSSLTNKGLHEVYVNVDRDEVDFATGAFTGTISGASFAISHITTLHFGADVPYFEVLNVFGPNLQTLDIDPNNPNYRTDDQGIVYDSKLEHIVLFPASFSGEYEIPAQMTKIQSGMFKNRTALEAIVIHNGVTEIGDEAFLGDTKLRTVTFVQGGAEPLTIKRAAFSGCTVLSDVILPDRLVSLGDQAFMGCEALVSLTLPKDLANIERNGTYGDIEIFDGCTSLTTFAVAEGNTHFAFKDGVLYETRKVRLKADDPETTYVPDRAIYVPDGATGEIAVSGYIRSIGNLAFGRSGSKTGPMIEKIVFADAIPTYDPDDGTEESAVIDFNPHSGTSTGEPIYRLSALTEVHFPAGMTLMPDYLVSSCNKLATVNVPYTVTSIQPKAFSSTSITSLTFDPTPEDAQEVGLRIEDASIVYGDHADITTSLFGSMSLTSITLPSRLAYLGKYAFANCTGTSWTSKIQTISFETRDPKGIALELGSRAFGQTKNLKTIELPESLTEIGEYAFYFSGIASIDLPETVTSIGDYAFGYSSLTSVTLHKGIASIGKGAFASSKLESITLPEGLLSIGDFAFNVATLSGELTIPASVTSIGKSAFTGTKFSKIATLAGNALASIGETAFSSNTTLAQFVFGKTDTPLTIGKSAFSGCTALNSIEFPQNIKEIGESAFANLTGLTSVTFAEGTSLLESIGPTAFSKTGITEIAFPESSAEGGITLGANLFKSCPSFTTMNLSASISSIDGVLGGCGSINKITVPENNNYLEADEELPIIYKKENGERGAILLIYGELSGDYTNFKIAGGTSIGSRAFAGQTELETVYIPASVQTIGDYAFQNCVNLKKVIIAQDSVLTKIGTGAFMNCYKLEAINLENATHLAEFGDGNYGSSPDNATYNGLFMNAGTKSENPLKIKLPASVTTLGKYMFTNSGAVEIDMSAATNITQLPAGGNTTSYGGIFYGLFSGSKKLTSVKLPVSITFLGTSTFADCTALTTLDLSGLTNLQYIGSSADMAPTSSTYSLYLFARCTGLQKVVFPASLKQMGGRAFYGCENLAAIEGLDDVTFPAGYAYAGAGITSVTIGADPKNYMFLDCTKLTSVTFGGSVTNITATSLFQNCTALETVDLSALTDLAALPNSMFAGCASLKNVTLPQGAKLTYLGSKTFQNCTALETINSSEKGTFDLSGLTGLKHFNGSKTGSSKSTSSDSYLFDGCESLKKLVLPDGFQEIGGYSFRNCTGLTNVTLTGILYIGKYAFAGAGLTQLTIPNTVTKLYEGAFSDCASLTDVTFDEGEGTVALTAGSVSSGKLSKPGVFGRSAVETVDFGNRVTALTQATFAECLSLTTIALPATLTGTMGTYVFFGCTNLTTADLSALTIASLGNYMFDGCSALEEVKLGNNLSHLGTYTFWNCTSLETIDISNTKIDRFSTTATKDVSTTAVYTFAGCTNLSKVIMKDGQILQVGPYTFQNCESLESFDFSKITHLGAGAFQNAGLTGTVTLPGTLTFFGVLSTGLSPFSGCSKVEKFEIEGSEGLMVQTSAATAYCVLVAKDGLLYLIDSGTEAMSLAVIPGGKTMEGDTLDFNDDAFKDPGLNFSGYSFAGIGNIKKVILPDGMTEIPDYMFDGSLVEEIVVPASVTSIGTNAFANTPNLKTVTFLAPAEGEEAQPLTLAAGSTSSTGTTGVFFGSGIQTLTLPERLVELPTGTFMNTTALKTLNLPSSVTKIPNYCFYGSATAGLQLTDSITSIGSYAYSHTTGLADLNAEDFKNVETIDSYAFEYSSVKNVVFPESLVTTKMDMFRYSDVVSVEFPGTVTEVGNYMFESCEHLVKVVFKDTADGVERAVALTGTFRYSKVQTVEIGEGITEIGSYCFLDCTELTKADLPESLTTIETQAFANCTKLKSIVIYDNIQSIALAGATSSYPIPTGTGPFSGWTEEQTIYFTASRFYIASFVGFDWMSNGGMSVKANIVFDYDPAAADPGAQA